jgi:hypothetical protein
VIDCTYREGEGYFLDTTESPLDDMLMALMESGIALPLPQTAENTADLLMVVAALRRIETRLLAAGLPGWPTTSAPARPGPW